MLSKLNVADGQITEYSIRSDRAIVTLKDWQEVTYTLVFNHVISIESYSPEHVDLCHIKVATESEQLRKTCAITEEVDLAKITQYSFISADNDFPVLSICAESVEVKT